MAAAEIGLLVEILAASPMAGEVIAGTGGCRKVRVAGKQKGKSGGFRAITFYSGEEMPVFLLTVLAKNERANLSHAESSALRGITQQIVLDMPTKLRKNKHE